MSRPAGMSLEERRAADAERNRVKRGRRRHAAFVLTGRQCACGETATMLVSGRPLTRGSLGHARWTMSSQRLREEIARRQPMCRSCASHSANAVRALLRDPVVMASRIREAINGI